MFWQTLSRDALAAAKHDRLDLSVKVEDARGAVASAGAGAASTPTHEESNFMRLMAEFARAAPGNVDFCNSLVQFVGDRKAAASAVTGAQPSASASSDVPMMDASARFNFGVAPLPPTVTVEPQMTFLGPIATLGRGRPEMGRGRSSSQPPGRQRRSTSRSAVRIAQGTTAAENKMPQGDGHDVLAEADAVLSAAGVAVGVTAAQTFANAVTAPWL